MNESVDIQSRLNELGYYQKITQKLSSKFNDLVANLVAPQETAKILKPMVSSSQVESVYCPDNHTKSSSTEVTSESTNETRTCSSCSKPNDDIPLPIWLLPRAEKLEAYERTVKSGGRLTEPEMTISFNDGQSSTASSSDDKKTFAEMTKFKRDVKRKRMKHRTTKAPPLTHTEELRGLISLQMELWEDYVQSKKKPNKRDKKHT